MTHTLETLLERALAEGYNDDDFVVKQLRRQIASKNFGKSFRELYVSGTVNSEPLKGLSRQKNSNGQTFTL